VLSICDQLGRYPIATLENCRYVCTRKIELDIRVLLTLPRYIQALKVLGLLRGPIRRNVQKYLIKKLGRGPYSTQFFGQAVEVWLDNTTDKKVLFSSKTYDKKEIDFLAKHLPDDGLLVDVGANSGLNSVGVLAKKRNANLIAIEPNPAMVIRAEKNLIELANSYAGNRKIIKVAVSDHAGSALIDLSTGLGTAKITNSINDQTISVRCDTLRSILLHEGIEKIDVLKIDIEGFEETVVPNILSSFSSNQLPRAIVMEKQAPGAVSALNALSNAGYVIEHQTRANLLYLRT
jgi:FkbM family methyltransferase